MPSLLDNPDATGNTQEIDMSGSQGSIKRCSRGGGEPRRQLRRTVSRTKQREGGASGLDDGGTQAQGRRQGRAQESQQDHAQGHPQDASDGARPIFDGVGHSGDQSVESRSGHIQKQTQTHAEKVRQERPGHTRGPPYVWAYLCLVKSLQQMSKAVGTRTAEGIATYWARLEPLSPTHICDEVPLCRLDKTYKARRP